MQFLLFSCMLLAISFGEAAANNTALFTNEDELFPTDYNNTEIGNGHEPEPVTMPSCPGNMEPRPFVDDFDHFSWRCQCHWRELYFPLIEACHEVYTQGPCPAGQYVNQSSVDLEVGHCIRNPCLMNGLVPYNGSCYTLETNNGACPPPAVLTIEPDTFELICRDISGDSLEHMIHVSVVEAPQKVHKPSGSPCPPGKKKGRNGACMTVWKKSKH